MVIVMAAQPLNGVTATSVLIHLTHSFRNLGLTTQTRFPGFGTKDAAAYEYVVAKTLARMANKRLEVAEQAAIKAGVIGDESKLVKGQEVTVWRPSSKGPPPIIITARTTNDRVPMLDKDMLTLELRKRFSKAITEDILAKSSKPVGPAVTYSVVFLN